MSAKKKMSGTAFSIPVGLGFSLLTSLGITLFGAAVIAWMLNGEKMGEGSIGYASMVILALAAGFGAFTGVRTIKKLRLQVCMMSGGIYLLTLLAITALFFGGQYQGIGACALIILAVCAVIAFLPSGNPRMGKGKKRVYR